MFWHVFRLLRPKQWVKNFFVFAPALFAGELFEAHALEQASWTFLFFCIASSCVYVLNDLRDIEADRSHPIKRTSRPLASGEVSVRAGIVTLVIGVAILGTGVLVIPMAMIAILGYIAVNVAYSLFARKIPVLDIFAIAFGFVLRVVAGAQAIAEPLSAWMFVTTLCLALYLAAMKRRHELRFLGDASRSSLSSYTVAVVERFAEISATSALVCYSIFVATVKVELVYTIPLVAFGLFRYWFIAEKLNTAESPTEAMLRDWQLVLAVATWGVVCASVLLFAGN